MESAVRNRLERHPGSISDSKGNRRGSSHLLLQPTRLIGREDDLERVSALLTGNNGRLLTLSGPGGVGKTRLAVALAERMCGLFPGGVWFVDLSPLTDHALALPAVTRELGIREEAGREPIAALAASLSDPTLLILDNLEHLRGAVPAIDTLLASCPGLTIVATSREPLRLRREQVFDVLPLTVPCSGRSSWKPTELAVVPAVELFVDRAQAADASFALSTDNAGAVAELTRRLDGLPLALELAATRTRVLDPAALLTWLDQGLTTLRWNTSDLPIRQRTLCATLDWSFALLGAEEQDVLRRLGVFAGGFTIEAVAEVAGTDELGVEALDVLTALAEKHLVRVQGGAGDEPRFDQLVTVREYALEQLRSNDTVDLYRDRHLAHYLALAEEANRAMLGPDEPAWLARLDLEIDNLRLAHEWAVTRKNVEAEWRLVVALALFWIFRGYLGEGSQRIKAALTRSSDAEPALRARLFAAAGNVAEWLGHDECAIARFEDSLQAARAVGDLKLVTNVLGHLAKLAYSRGDATRARTLAEEMLAQARSIDSGWAIGLAYAYLVGFAIGPHGQQREWERLQRELDEPAQRLRDVGGQRGLAVLLVGRARLLARADAPAAFTSLREALQVARGLDDPSIISFVPWLATVLLADYLSAEQVARFGAAAMALEQRAAAIGSRTLIALYGSPQDHAVLAQAMAAARTALGDEAFSAAGATAETLTFAALIDELLAALPDLEVVNPTGRRPAEQRRSMNGLLSPRELDVLALVARGHTNKAIAEVLFVAPSTVKTHICSLLTKLEADNRAQLATIAVQRDLLPE